LYIISISSTDWVRLWHFFFSFGWLASFYTISKPWFVARAKNSCVWLQVM
jgi:hypothetical protein